MRAPLRPIAFVVTLALALAARPAFAQEWIHVDHCDTATVSGVLVQNVSFTVTNHSAGMVATLDLMDYFEPAPGDTCHALGFVAPPGTTKMATGDNHPAWIIGGFGFGLTPGQSKSGFEMTLSKPACCFTAVFGPGGGPIGDYTKILGECFECPALVTPADATSWGKLKVLYR